MLLLHFDMFYMIFLNQIIEKILKNHLNTIQIMLVTQYCMQKLWKKSCLYDSYLFIIANIYDDKYLSNRDLCISTVIIYQIHLTCMLTITILDRYLPAYPPTIHQMQMLMYISAPRMIKAVSLVLRGLGQPVIGHLNTDHL